eukprot:TRINITY_DN6222_c1_g3_i3.p1 TRINITY_DN6222_c1_g3~~TRINITY_DN6222_c1_g3_i3.p1  ORF type:complete len:444 (+),score=136.92 TRINITY_DN6222_c1_g3_i3:1613-2944(+)
MLVERNKQRAAETERTERGLTALREREREAEGALRSLAALTKELAEFHSTLHSELILADEDVVRLRSMELKMRPARPSRLRRRNAGSSQPSLAEDEPLATNETPTPRGTREITAGSSSVVTPRGTSKASAVPCGSGESVGSASFCSDAPTPTTSVVGDCGTSVCSSAAVAIAGAAADIGDDEEAPPTWDDARFDQEFRASPHFRSFSRLRGQREKLWLQELRWTQRLREKLEARGQQLAKDRVGEDKEATDALEEEDRLRQEIAVLDDPEGHALRHETAAAAAVEAREVARRAASEAAEAEGLRQMAEQRLEKSQVLLKEEEARVAEAQEEAANEAARSAWARLDLLARTRDLESRMRTFVEEWRTVSLDEHRVAIMRARVTACLASEADGRASLREELRRLLEDLQRLDQQLAVDPSLEDAAAQLVAGAGAGGSATARAMAA